MDNEKLKINMGEKSPERYSEKWLMTQTLIMRDTGEEFTVEYISPEKAPNDIRRTVKIKSKKDTRTVSKNLNELLGNLKTSGSPWSVKE